jgi:hypothetical protein
MAVITVYSTEPVRLKSTASPDAGEILAPSDTTISGTIFERSIPKGTSTLMVLPIKTDSPNCPGIVQERISFLCLGAQVTDAFHVVAEPSSAVND